MFMGVDNLKTKIVILLILCFMFAAFAQGAVEVTSGLTTGKVLLAVDYGDLREGNESLALDPLSLTFENKGNTSEAVSLSFSGLSADYQLSLSETSFTLDAVGGNTTTKTVTLDSVVPAKVDSGSHDIGKLMVGSTEYVIQTEVKSMLSIDDIKVYVDGEKETTLDKDGDDIKDIRPGSNIELRFRLDSLFDNDYGEGDIEGAELTVQFKDSDDEDDFDDEIDEGEEFDIDAGDSEDGIILNFDVPTTAKEGTYDLLITLEGEDDNNANHLVEWTIGLEIDRKKDDVQFESVSLTSDTVACEGSTILKLKLINYGSNTQKEAAISVYSSDLGLNENFADIYLDEDPDEDDNSWSKTIPIVVTDDIKTGDHYIEVYAYIDNDEQIDYHSVRLTVDSCSTTGTTNQAEDTTEVVVVPPAGNVDNQQSTTTPFIETTETSFGESKGMMVLLGVAVVLLLVFIILIIVFLLRGNNFFPFLLYCRNLVLTYIK